MEGNKGERRKKEWEISERETEHERLLTLGNELGVVEGEEGGGWGWVGDGHWGGYLTGWALGVILYVGKLNTNKNYFIKNNNNLLSKAKIVAMYYGFRAYEN